ncbi:MAG TPA: transposase, partial [Patescibacteria group bacterium]|nr:transposase [Patescibacteria group bacterium]
MASNRLSAEQKLNAVDLVLKQGKTVSSVAASHAVTRQALYKWIKEVLKCIEENKKISQSPAREAFLRVLDDQYSCGKSHWNWSGDEVRELVTELAVSNPAA